MNITDAANIVGIPQRSESALEIETRKAAEQWAGEVNPTLIHTHRMAFLDGVQYGLKMAQRSVAEDER